MHSEYMQKKNSKMNGLKLLLQQRKERLVNVSTSLQSPNISNLRESFHLGMTMPNSLLSPIAFKQNTDQTTII